MRTLFVLLGVLAAFHGIARAEPDGTNVPTPILQVFEPKVTGTELSQFSYDAAHPLLVLQAVKEVRLAQDHKGVMLVLKEDDAKALAAMTRDFDGRVLVFVAPGGATRPLNITGPVEDGRIGFKYPEAEAMAEAMRRYFHLAEFAGPSAH